MAVSGKSYQNSDGISTLAWDNPIIVVTVSGLITLIIVISCYFIIKEYMRGRRNRVKKEFLETRMEEALQNESRPSQSFISDYSDNTLKNSIQTLVAPKTNRYKSNVSYF